MDVSDLSQQSKENTNEHLPFVTYGFVRAVPMALPAGGLRVGRLVTGP